MGHTEDNLITIGRDYKYGGFDFGVRGDIQDLTVEEMNQLRAMIVVAIGTAEDIWRRANEKRSQAGQKAI